MNRSPLHDLHARHGARFVDFGGWEMPVRYASVIAEHRAVRSSAGLFDVTHLGRFRLGGSGARPALDRLLSNDLARIEPGKTQYTMILNDEGGIVDDLIVWWRSADEYWVLPNAANHDRVMAAFSEEPGCEIEDLQPTTVMVALQGPEAIAAFERVLGAAPGRFRTADAMFAGHEVQMAGTGYTGERGGEICINTESADQLVTALVETGVTLCGLGARDTLRLEAGLPLWGADIDETTTPLEAGLGYAVALDHDFVGREALATQKASGITRRLVGFVMEGRGVPRHGYGVRTASGGGSVTSGNISPVLDTGVGLAYVSPPPRLGEAIEVEIRTRMVPATIVKPPFYKR